MVESAWGERLTSLKKPEGNDINMDYPTPDGRYCRCGSGFWVYPDSNPHQTLCDECLQKKRNEEHAKDKKIEELTNKIKQLEQKK